MLGDRAGAEKIFAQLGTMAQPFDRGASVLAQAEAAACLGQKVATGAAVSGSLFAGVIQVQIHALLLAFVTMKGDLAPFDELVKPSG